MHVHFYETADDTLLKFAVIVSKSNGKWVFCKHKERDTYEVPGGHRENGETILEAAKRELFEETGFPLPDISDEYQTGMRILRDRKNEGKRNGRGKLRNALLCGNQCV